ncbi:uncharacterized protein LOC110713298 [Chenopodium quinoa]|uniref:uncharacterized protein LOC110713298 n=1 Tax=Chenopodium quinoa TaxID=63459 RepID=UPI000B77ABB5|nr:uncharacterized protein LOC110713298 [Chenopodium quinoa]
MNKTEEEVVYLIEDVVRYHMDWQEANTLKESVNTSPSSLHSQEVEPKKPVYSITTKSGKVLDERVSRESEEDERMSDSCEEKENNVLKSVTKEEVQEKKKSDESSKVSENSNEKSVEKERKQDEDFKPRLPYPQKFNAYKLDEQFGRFIDMLRKIHRSIPFTDVLGEMPNYSKFLKEILNGKRNCNANKPVSLGECFSAFIHNDLLPKMKDPKNFSIPCNINGKLFQNALCDVGASVSIKPYSIFNKLKLG